MNMEPTAIIGHKSICRFLKNALDKHQESHAYLFLGQALIGKGVVAKWLAEQVAGPLASGKNLIWLDPAAGIRIADIRKLRSDLSLTNPFGGYRVAVLRRAEKMTPEAQNAFLKILEEPKTPVVFILTAETKKGLLPTVVSRVQLVRFSPVPKQLITESLLRDGVAPEVAERATAMSLGCPGKAKALSQADNLNLAEKWPREIVALFSQWPHQRFRAAYQVLEAEEIDIFRDSAETVWRDLWLSRQGGRSDIVNVGLRSEIAGLAKRLSLAQIARGLQAVKNWNYLQARHVNKKLLLESFMLKAFPSNII